MPFGLLWGAAYFVAIAALVAVRFRSMPPGFRATEVFLAVLLLGLAVGLLSRQRWARWAGVGVGAYVAIHTFGWVKIIGTAWDLAVFLGACLTVALLVIPATGDVVRGLATGERPGSRLGAVVGLLTAFALVGFMATYALAFQRLTSDPNRALQARGGAVEWAEFGPGLERAAAEGKPVLVDFFAEWCQPCKVMDQRTFRDPDVVRALQGVVPVRIDAEGTEPVHGYRGEDLANRYAVATYPTLVLMDASGREIARSRGAKGPAGFLTWLSDALSRAESGEYEAAAPDLVM